MAIENWLNDDNDLYKAYPKKHYKKKLIQQSLELYYEDIDNPIIFDKNRSWTHRPEYIKQYFDIPDAKIICTVRDLDEILASFISMIHRSKRLSFIDKAIVKGGHTVNDFVRCQYIASDGPMGRAYTGLQTAFKKGFKNNIHLVEYNDLVNDPENIMKGIYTFLNEPPFIHDFDNIKNDNKERDEETYGLPDMHHVRSTISTTSKSPEEILPAKVIEDVKGLEFWRE